ncbi:MaoC/PaaZ C-terminal domain-containing protein [Pseudoduganella sp. RAF53_2]|uniref:MaoC/PaaZ C-terminal domain-containing protein n=1 Tax=unclassified Pseudoduganella TaxID=2637179 RepID=UPI003F9A01FA
MAEITNQLPSTSLLGLLRGALRARSGQADEAAMSASYRVASVDAAQMRACRELLGLSDERTPVAFHYLIAQRAHLAAMVGRTFPFKLAGMIHVENRIVELAPLDMDLEIVVHNTLRIEPPTPAGARFCVFDTLAEQRGVPVFRCESRYLAVRGEKRGSAKAATVAQAHAEVGRWELSADAGRRYARVSGDWNPIHLWAWSARLFGLERPIIHGMQTIGKACALLEAAAGQRVRSISARFLAPIALGSEVRLEADWREARFYIHAGDRLAVEGTFEIDTQARIDVL